MNDPHQPSFTAAQLAAALGKTPQAVRRVLRDKAASGFRIVKGVEVKAWTVSELPASLHVRLLETARARGYRDVESLLSKPPVKWNPLVPIGQVHGDDLLFARKLRTALRRWVTQGNDDRDLTSSELEAAAIEDYARTFGRTITRRYWRELFSLVVQRDGGAEDWDRIEIYLPRNQRRKSLGPIEEALEREFASVEDLVRACGNDGDPDRHAKEGIWCAVFRKYAAMVKGGMPDKRVAKQLRKFLFARAPFLAASRAALSKAFDRKLTALQEANWKFEVLYDARRNNGEEVIIPKDDQDLLSHSAAYANGGRIDAAWREKYGELSLAVRERYPYSQCAPRKIHELIGERVKYLNARHQSRLKLRRMMGGVQRTFEGLASGVVYLADDVTSNIEVAYRPADGPEQALLPQIIAVMDDPSHKIVGWAVSTDKGPTAELVCEAVADAFRRNKVSKVLGLENGFVFGKSLNINGKKDAQGRALVPGLSRYGCEIRHFEKMNPTSKANLEKSFDLLQRLMERHPGYGGRNQMFDAPEEFKREQVLIRAGKMEPSRCRYTFEEFVKVFAGIVEQYNSTPQHGQLCGVSPNDAFEKLKDPSDPQTEFTPELEWLLANEPYQVEVKANGVRFTHLGQALSIKGAQLTKLAPGMHLWALVERRDPSLVTFMNLDFTNPFTMPVCQKVPAREKEISSGTSILAAERAKLREHERAVNEDYRDLRDRFGNPRKDLLQQFRQGATNAIANAPARLPVVDPKLGSSAKEMHQQREDLKAERRKQSRRGLTNLSLAKELGVHAALIDDSEETREALEMQRLSAQEEEAT